MSDVIETCKSKLIEILALRARTPRTNLYEEETVSSHWEDPERMIYKQRICVIVRVRVRVNCTVRWLGRLRHRPTRRTENTSSPD